jgi:hypothetical protein
MERRMKTGKSTISMLLTAVMLSSCMPSDVPRSNVNYATANGTGANGPGATTTPTAATTTTSLPKVEIRHLIEPNIAIDSTYNPGTGLQGAGSYVRKLTLPKNFAGKLYLAGINFGTLSSNIVKVRFKFGLNRDPITVPATVTYAPGITPSTNIQILAMDLRAEQFRDIRLPYDLFDYNDYTDPAATPVQNNRDSNLYCRGLQLIDDPTFEGVGECDGSPLAEKCLYSYAKVLDQGLVRVNTSGGVTTYVPSLPSFPAIRSQVGSSYYTDFLATQLRKPLPDLSASSFVFSSFQTGSGTDSANLSFSVGSQQSITSTLQPSINGTYLYAGPYRLINLDQWQISPSTNNIVSGSGLFIHSESSGSIPPVVAPTGRIYFQSFMFPLAAKIDLQANIPYVGSAQAFAALPRSAQVLSVAGKSLWMDGASARALNRNTDLEHIGSCNVSSSIEIIAKDKNNIEYVIATTKDVKLQLVRPVAYVSDTLSDVLYGNYATCTSNATCGGNGCCFNNRCWDQTLVSQCLEPSLSTVNLSNGASCTTDLQCQSLCCNRTSGLCSPHNTLVSPAVTCSKPVGDYCIAKEWCQKVPITKFLIVRTGTDAQGNTTCRLQAYITQEYGDCKNGVCVAPPQELPPDFDPNNPDCTDAVPPPTF